MKQSVSANTKLFVECWINQCSDGFYFIKFTVFGIFLTQQNTSSPVKNISLYPGCDRLPQSSFNRILIGLLS
ncbi:MAG: hypothetical protein V7K40_00065 [Nostoc sp.]|uniref:hypothetical protein n=1 Tax=Nostoc sp. TaxID=1180 RepID=UPI002FF49F73